MTVLIRENSHSYLCRPSSGIEREKWYLLMTGGRFFCIFTLSSSVLTAKVLEFKWQKTTRKIKD